MTLGGTSHPVGIGVELRVVRSLRRPENGWQIGVPVSFRMLNGSIYGRGGKTIISDSRVSPGHISDGGIR